MKTADAVVIVIFTLAALFAGLAWYRRYGKGQDRLKRLQKNGVRLTATVIKATTLTSGDNSASVQVHLKYTMPDGIVHEGVVTQTFNLADAPRKGNNIAIYVNRLDANDLIIAS